MGCAGGGVVREHARYAAGSGSNPSRKSFAAGHNPLSLSPMFHICLMHNKGVYAKKILKKIKDKK